MEINSVELQQKIKNGEKVIVEFWGTWCQPCRVMKPAFEKVAEEYRKENSEVQLYTMDVDKNKEFAASLGVRAIPTVKSFSGGKEVHTQSGIQMEPQIKQLINNLING